jgi:hypothetical protein
VQLGEALAGSRGADAMVKPGKYYTLRSWLQSFLQGRVEPAMVNPWRAQTMDRSLQFFLHSDRRRPEINEIIINSRLFKIEFDEVVAGFFRHHPEGERVILARYDKALDVVDGVAAQEGPVDSFERRIRELQEAARLPTPEPSK